MRNLVHLMKHREKLSQDGFCELASKIMNAEDEGRGSEYGPDFERREIVDAFSIAIRWSLEQKKHLDEIHGLPCEGDGWRIVAGLLPRDADQVVQWGERKLHDASQWRFTLDPGRGAIVVHAPGVPATKRINIAENLIVAEVGEVNAARYLKTVEIADKVTRETTAVLNSARTFADVFPDCEYRALLSTKKTLAARKEKHSETGLATLSANCRRAAKRRE